LANAAFAYGASEDERVAVHYNGSKDDLEEEQKPQLVTEENAVPVKWLNGLGSFHALSPESVLSAH